MFWKRLDGKGFRCFYGTECMEADGGTIEVVLVDWGGPK